MPDTDRLTSPCDNPDCADAVGIVAALDHQNTRLDQEITRLNGEVTRLTGELTAARTENREPTQRLHAAEQQRANYTPPSHDRVRDEL